MDAPDVETVAVEKGAQTALTTSAYCWLIHKQATDPSSALIVMNSTIDAREKSDETWRPLWEDSPRLQQYLPHDKRKDWTKLYQLVNRAPVYWIGANSPGRLGAKPIRRLILDELDKYPKQTKRETGAAALARQRTKTFKKKGLAKIIEFSTPTKDNGEIHIEYLNGDQRQFYVPCQHCGKEQIMVWANFKIDMELAKENPAEAVKRCYYECPHCKRPWSDQDRWENIERGTWKATAKPKDPKCRSFRFPSWLSTFITHEYLAAQWLKTRNSVSNLQDFINSECGEPFANYENRIKDETFAVLEGDYKEGELFADAPIYAPQYEEVEDRFVFGGVDVQKGYLVGVFRQFVQGGNSGLVWSGDIANFRTLDRMAEKFGAKFVLIDQRYRTREVQEFCANNAGYIPTVGVTRKARALFTTGIQDIDEGRRGQGMGREIEVINHDPDQLKDMLAYMIQQGEDARRWLVPEGYASNIEYVAQMTAEKNINGRWEPVPKGAANHYWDAEVLALLAAIRFQVWTYYYDPTDDTDTEESP